jgi:hypothetical protein
MICFVVVLNELIVLEFNAVSTPCKAKCPHCFRLNDVSFLSQMGGSIAMFAYQKLPQGNPESR